MKRALVIGSLVTAGLVLACDDDAMGPNTTGSISIRIVVGQRNASAATAPAATRTAEAPKYQVEATADSEEPSIYLGPARGVSTTFDTRKSAKAIETRIKTPLITETLLAIPVFQIFLKQFAK